jgi:esterase/lipase superfamily enzyme
VTTVGTPAPTLTETGTLPAGVSFVAGANGTATLSGTPTTVGSSRFTLIATNRTGTVSLSFTLTVDRAPTITSAASYTARVGTAFSFKVTTVGTPPPTLTEVGARPAGVAFVAGRNGTAIIAGAPAAAGTFALTITATSTAGTVAQHFALTVDRAPAITSAGSYTAKVGTAFSFEVTTSGYPPPTLTETGTLPAGVTFAAGRNGTATIAGQPTGATPANGDRLSIRATSVAGAVTQTFTLAIDK